MKSALIGGLIFFVTISAQGTPKEKPLIEVEGDASACCIGEGAALTDFSSYWAQSFIALGKRIRHFEFYALDNFSDIYSGSFNFRLLLVEGRPNELDFGNVIFESDPVFLENGRPLFSTIQVSMDCAKLIPGNPYTWIVDAYSMRDGALDVGQIYVSRYDPYSDGQFYTLYATGLGRETDLSATWTPTYGFDIAFHMAFFSERSLPPTDIAIDPESTMFVTGSCRF